MASDQKVRDDAQVMPQPGTRSTPDHKEERGGNVKSTKPADLLRDGAKHYQISAPGVHFAHVPPLRPVPDLDELRSAVAARKVLPALTVGRKFHPSPAAWEDEVVYFLLLDRFSDGRETDFIDNAGAHAERVPGTRPYATGDVGGRDPDRGRRWLGGTLHGLAEKIGYLKRLGVTAIWVSPVFKQVPRHDSYHGYAVQNFLQVDPHFARNDLPSPWNDPREALRAFVALAHQHGVRVILDIILNHTGDVFVYAADRYPTDRHGREHRDAEGRTIQFPRFDGHPYGVKGMRDAAGEPTLPLGAKHPEAWPDGSVWPEELQAAEAFTCLGEITNWEWEPESLNGDFASLKNLYMGSGEIGSFVPSPGLIALTEAYKFWMAYADIDGFRIDTVKHVELGAIRYFASVIHEFAECLGKENFYLIGEVTGGRPRAFHTVEQTGIDAALGIDDIPHRLEDLIMGRREPNEYFTLFRNSQHFGKESHAWFNDKIVTMFNDHDMVGRDTARLCAASDYPDARSRERVALLALATNVTTLGIPCIYYGSEQCFDGESPAGTRDDVYLRESMFGGGFGSRGTGDRHFFDEKGWVFRKLQRLLKLRHECMCLRRGRQYLREISGDGEHFSLPTGYGGSVRSIVAWSRLFDEHEVLVAMNTDLSQSLAAWVTIDARLNACDESFQCVFDNGEAADGSRPSDRLTVEDRNGKSVLVTMPPGAFAIFAKSNAVRPQWK